MHNPLLTNRESTFRDLNSTSTRVVFFVVISLGVLLKLTGVIITVYG